MVSRQEQALRLNVCRLSEQLGKEHLAVADAWVSLGLAELENGYADEAESSFGQAMGIRLHCLSETDETVVQLHYYIGRCRYERGEFSAAQASYDLCLDIYDRECRPEDAFLATVLDGLASLYHDRDKFVQAQAYLKRSLFIRFCVLEPSDPSIADSLNHLGWLYSQHGEFARAERLFLSALDIWIATLGLEHACTTMCLENYAYVLDKTGRCLEAGQLLSKVESIRSLQESEYK